MAHAHVRVTLIFEDHVTPALVGLQHVARIALIVTGHYPGQPSTRTQPPITPCCCVYAPAVTELERTCSARFGTATLHDYVWRFTIAPECPHHGQLDDDERRG